MDQSQSRPDGQAKPERQAPSGRMPSPWTVLLATTALQALVSGVALTPPVLVIEAAGDVGFDAALVGIYTALMYLGAMTASLISGSIVPSVGSMRVSQICLLLVGCGLAGLALAQPLLLVPASLVLGLGYGAVTPASSHMLARTTPPHRRGLIFSIKQTGVPLGGVLAGGLVPWLVLWWGWQSAAVIMAAAAVLMIVCVQPLRPPLDQDRKAGARAFGVGWIVPLMLVWRRRDLRMMALASFCFAAVQLAFTSYLVTFLVSRLGINLVVAGGVLAASQVAGSVGRIGWGLLADRWLGTVKMLTILSIVMAVTASMSAFFSSEWPFWLVCSTVIVFGASVLGWNGIYLGEVAHVAGPEHAGQATGGSLFFTYCGVVFGASLFALVVGTIGYTVAFLLSAGVAALGGGCVLVARTRSGPEGQS